MDKQYIARQSVGRFHSGSIVGGLSDAQIQDLLERGVIEEVKETSEAKPAVSSKATKEVKVDG
ncbi:hypothetical protein ACG92Y_12410 [Acinetobacter ursingii]|uniref:hypothetical protein n=1 Tax=Acinetobacter ursingii TaxID=108980 RepID=UPI00124C249B|nr:hypothetical protein [Acinetobacter ursingii]MCU4495293.1 hypothetical protein [Acinetobacter ursingii]NOZ96866.1 hypothetical protein [Gammaproteobacteria bacterium]